MKGLILLCGVKHNRVGCYIMYSNYLLRLDLGCRQDLATRAHLLMLASRLTATSTTITMAALLRLFLLDYVLQEAVTRLACNRHISILFELRVVALCLA